MARRPSVGAVPSFPQDCAPSLAPGPREYVESEYHAVGSIDFCILEFEVSAHTIIVVLERRVQNEADAVPAWAKHIFAESHVLHRPTRWTRVDSKSAEVAVEN